jgi:hypothetical protein
LLAIRRNKNQFKAIYLSRINPAKFDLSEIILWEDKNISHFLEIFLYQHSEVREQEACEGAE